MQMLAAQNVLLLGREGDVYDPTILRQIVAR
jgi:hypothetical protein